MEGRQDDLNPSRFWRHVQRTDSCWLWRGALYSIGYGRLRVHGRERVAHRVAYELMIGPVPENALVGHLCDQRACVRPDHLELIEGIVRLTPEQVGKILQSLLPHRRLARLNGVSHTRIIQLRRYGSALYN